MFPHLEIREEVFIWEEMRFLSVQKIGLSQLNTEKDIAGA